MKRTGSAKQTGPYCQSLYACHARRLFTDISLQRFKDRVDHCGVGVDVKVDRLGEIQAEDTHDGFGVNHISAGYQIEVIIEFGDIIYKRFYLVNRV